MIKLYSTKLMNKIILLKLNHRYKSIVKALDKIGNFDTLVELKESNDTENDLYVTNKNNEKYYFNSKKRDIYDDKITKIQDLNNDDTLLCANLPKKIVYEYEKAQKYLTFKDIFKQYELDNECTFEVEITRKYTHYFFNQGFIRRGKSVEAIESIELTVEDDEKLSDVEEQLLFQQLQNKKRLGKISLLQFHNLYNELKPIDDYSERDYTSYYGDNVKDFITYVEGDVTRTNLPVIPKVKKTYRERSSTKCKIIKLFK